MKAKAEYTNSQMVRLIQDNVHSERDRNILYLRLINGMTYEAISEKVELSSKQVYRIITREAAKLYPLLCPAQKVL